MTGNFEVIAALNQALKEELTAINQYFLHAEMCENWHYDRLGSYIKKQSIDEMKHAEAIIERILFLDATPILTELMQLTVGKNVKEQLEGDLKLEVNAVASTTVSSPFRARRRTTRRVSCFSACSKTKKSTLIGLRRNCIKSKKSATSATCPNRWAAQSSELRIG